jgi:hypothetical protein
LKVPLEVVRWEQSKRPRIGWSSVSCRGCLIPEFWSIEAGLAPDYAKSVATRDRTFIEEATQPISCSRLSTSLKRRLEDHIPVRQILSTNMSDQIQELIDIPRDFIKDGTMFINRCTKRTCAQSPRYSTHCGHELTDFSRQTGVHQDLASCGSWLPCYGW